MESLEIDYKREYENIMWSLSIWKQNCEDTLKAGCASDFSRGLWRGELLIINLILEGTNNK